MKYAGFFRAICDELFQAFFHSPSSLTTFWHGRGLSIAPAIHTSVDGVLEAQILPGLAKWRPACKKSSFGNSRTFLGQRLSDFPDPRSMGKYGTKLSSGCVCVECLAGEVCVFVGENIGDKSVTITASHVSAFHCIM